MSEASPHPITTKSYVPKVVLPPECTSGRKDQQRRSARLLSLPAHAHDTTGVTVVAMQLTLDAQIEPPRVLVQDRPRQVAHHVALDEAFVDNLSE